MGLENSRELRQAVVGHAVILAKDTRQLVPDGHESIGGQLQVDIVQSLADLAYDLARLTPLMCLPSAAVSDAVKAIPVPQNGKDGKDGRDGLDVVTPILKDGTLLFTMSDGSVKEVGRVVGENGKDGADGRDGVDGLGFDDLSADYDGERTITLKMQRGEQVKDFTFTMPVVIDRGVWSEGKAYDAGDAVTWAGSVWIAQKATTEKPDDGDGWRLSVKRGRDGKAGTVRDTTPKPVKVF